MISRFRWPKRRSNKRKTTNTSAKDAGDGVLSSNHSICFGDLPPELVPNLYSPYMFGGPLLFRFVHRNLAQMLLLSSSLLFNTKHFYIIFCLQSLKIVAMVAPSDFPQDLSKGQIAGPDIDPITLPNDVTPI